MLSQFKSLINSSKAFFLLYLSVSAQMPEVNKAAYGRTKERLNYEQDKKDNSLYANSDPYSSLLNPFYTESICELYKNEGENLLKLAAQKQEKQQSLVKKLTETIKYSSKFLEKYKTNKLYLQKVIEETEHFFFALMKNPDSYCQLEAVLSKDNHKFEIVLCLLEELSYNKRGREVAHYQYKTNENNYNEVIINRISLAPELWATQGMDFRKITEIIDHEVCHAFNAYQNLQKSMLDPLPCDITILANKETRQYCREVNDILIAYQTRLQKLINIFSTPIKQRTHHDQEIFGKFIDVTADYKPRRYEKGLLAEDIDKLKREGKIKDNLELTSKPTYLSFSIKREDKPKPVAVYNIIDSGKGYFIATYDFNVNKNIAQVCLQDLQLWNNKIKDLYSNDILTYIEELDAGLYGILIQYPALYDFMLPGMRQYRAKRSDSQYQQCISIADDHLTLSP